MHPASYILNLLTDAHYSRQDDSLPSRCGHLPPVAVLVFLIFQLITHDLVEVRVAEVTRQNLISSVSTNGKVEPIDEFQAYAPAPGVVAKLYVDVVQKVKAGDLLVKMNDSDAVAKLASANAALRTAEVTLHDMEQGGSQEERITLSRRSQPRTASAAAGARDLEALQQLQQKGAASASEVAAAQERLHTANSSLQSLQNAQHPALQPSRQATASRHRSPTPGLPSTPPRAATTIQHPHTQAGTVYSIPVSTYDFVARRRKPH